jgi:hypothetical protein
MVSSTYTDLKEHRAALIQALNGHDLHPKVMEYDSAKPVGDVVDSSLQMVRDSAAYILVISQKYGQIPECSRRNPDNLSITELEFNEAQRLQLPTLLFIMGEGHPLTKLDVERDGLKEEKLNAFRERAKTVPASNVNRVYAVFESLEDFKDKLPSSLRDLCNHLGKYKAPSELMTRAEEASSNLLELLFLSTNQLQETTEPQFEWNVFLSYSSCDKGAARDLATRLADDGVRVWFDEWIIRHGDNIFAANEDGLQRSRAVLLLLSKDALVSNWATLERLTAFFRDPTNRNRRFIPVRLDDAEIPDTLRFIRYVYWRSTDKVAQYEQLLTACGVPHSATPPKETYHSVFTPGAPPTNAKLLVGRDDAVNELRDYILSPGIHPIVIGPRGVGKTSLIQIALRQDPLALLSRVEVNTVRDFNECCHHVCADLEIRHDVMEFTPAAFLRVLQSSERKAVIALDELDDLPDKSDLPRLLAKFAKAASNQSDRMAQSFIFSGISNDAHSLFRGHLSSPRNFPVIYLPPIRQEHIVKFFDIASEVVGTDIPNHIRREIAADADGFPYYVHQVGFHMFACFERDPTASTLSPSHFVEGKRRASDSAFAHYLGRYKFTIYKLTPIHKRILQVLVFSKKRHFSFKEIESVVQIDSQKPLDEVKRGFRWLLENEYIRYRKVDDTVCLVDPLLKPFLKIKLHLNDHGRGISGQLRLF